MMTERLIRNPNFLETLVHGEVYLIDAGSRYFNGFLDLYSKISSLFKNWDDIESISAWFQPNQEDDEDIESLLFVNVVRNTVVAFAYVEYYKKIGVAYFMYIGSLDFSIKQKEIHKETQENSQNAHVANNKAEFIHATYDNRAAITLGGVILSYLRNEFPDCKELIVAVDSPINSYNSRIQLYKNAYKRITKSNRDIYLINDPQFIEPITYIWDRENGNPIGSVDELLARDYHSIPFLYAPLALSDHSTPPAITKKRVERIVRTILMKSYRNAYYYNKKKNKEYREYVKQFYKKFYEDRFDEWPNFVKLVPVSKYLEETRKKSIRSKEQVESLSTS